MSRTFLVIGLIASSHIFLACSAPVSKNTYSGASETWVCPLPSGLLEVKPSTMPALNGCTKLSDFPSDQAQKITEAVAEAKPDVSNPGTILINPIALQK
ncbi:MAG: hypothetical protein H7249_04090 [Chitinophagaceae bacterium]|nr:hypothetical protein [Oligoflexus sp.]